ncbi:MAG: hypothetical protein IT210_25590 [Armatimonadetes bacterium]|nr:hypothetical protein [Armatimonadota bacterium]
MKKTLLETPPESMVKTECGQCEGCLKRNGRCLVLRTPPRGNCWAKETDRERLKAVIVESACYRENFRSSAWWLVFARLCGIALSRGEILRVWKTL